MLLDRCVIADRCACAYPLECVLSACIYSMSVCVHANEFAVSCSIVCAYLQSVNHCVSQCVVCGRTLDVAPSLKC